MEIPEGRNRQVEVKLLRKDSNILSDVMTETFLVTL